METYNSHVEYLKVINQAKIRLKHILSPYHSTYTFITFFFLVQGQGSGAPTWLVAVHWVRWPWGFLDGNPWMVLDKVSLVHLLCTYLSGSGTLGWGLAPEISLVNFYPPHVGEGPAHFASVPLL